MPFSLYSCFHSNNGNSNTYDVKGNGIAKGFFFVQPVGADWKQNLIKYLQGFSGSTAKKNTLII